MQNRPPKPGVPAHEPVAQGARPHLKAHSPATRHSLKLGALGAAEVRAQPSHSLRQFLALYTPAEASNPECAELRSLILETAEAA